MTVSRLGQMPPFARPTQRFAFPADLRAELLVMAEPHRRSDVLPRMVRVEPSPASPMGWEPNPERVYHSAAHWALYCAAYREAQT